MRLQLSLAGQEAKLVARTFDAIAKPVFVCGPDGLISNMSQPAVELAQEGRRLTSRRDRLVLVDANAQGNLARVIGETIFQFAVGRASPTIRS